MQSARNMKTLAMSFSLLTAFACARAATVSPLYARGYSVLPQPQRVNIGASDFSVGADLRLETAGVAPTGIEVATLREELAKRFRIHISQSGAAAALRLVIAPGSVAVGPAQDNDKQAIAAQAYAIDMKPGRIAIKANAPAGLFYGVVTLLQLLTPRNGAAQLPEGTIEDWPDLRARHIYWDDAHHLDTTEALKHAIRQAAFFKINGIAIKLEGHFQFHSAPAVTEPQALSPAQLQDLTSYALRYHVQLIPYLDAPAHIAFILKHPEYASLREFPDSNYEICATNPASYQLFQGMFQDLLDANKGVQYVYLSTDEPYYVGLAHNNQCDERTRAKELGSPGKLLAQFVTKLAEYLRGRGRTVVFWGEYPLKPSDIPALPPYLVNGEVYGPEFDAAFRRRGIRQMIYTSSEGEEKLFPAYYNLPPSKRLHAGAAPAPPVANTFEKISYDTARKDADLIGAVNAGWGDMGLHPETFWLGYATASAAAWHPGAPDPDESAATFYPLYYGPSIVNMDRVYQLMSTQAEFWSDSWETEPSTTRKPIWGNSAGIFNPPKPAHDQTLPLPPAPAADLTYRSDWTQSNSRRLELAADFQTGCGQLFALLYQNLRRADQNRYNLEVFLSIAKLYRQNLETIRGIGQMDALLRDAAASAKSGQSREAVRLADRAIAAARAIQLSRNRALADATTTWYQSWLPRLKEANGRRFLHQLDDVKDHLPDRTTDMSYLVYRELLLPFGDWVNQVLNARNAYALAHGIPARNGRFDWADLKPVSESQLFDIPLE